MGGSTPRLEASKMPRLGSNPLIHLANLCAGIGDLHPHSGMCYPMPRLNQKIFIRESCQRVSHTLRPMSRARRYPSTHKMSWSLRFTNNRGSNIMLTPAQVRWASHHDWFISDNRDGTITILDTWVDPTGNYQTQTRMWFDGFTALRNWAGY